jgi:hypothetical protein
MDDTFDPGEVSDEELVAIKTISDFLRDDARPLETRHRALNYLLRSAMGPARQTTAEGSMI